MDIQIESRPLRALRADGAVLLLAKGEPAPARAGALGVSYRAAVTTLVKRRLFEGGLAQVQTVVGGPQGRVASLTLVGLGELKRLDADGLRRAAALGIRAACDQGARTLVLVLPSGPGRALEAERVARAVAEAALLALYRWESYRTEKAKTGVDRLTLVVAPRAKAAARRGLQEGMILAQAVCFARDLGNEPSNVATPRWLADKAVEMARAEGLTARVIEKDEMERLGMGSLLGVARGSAQPPKLVVLTHEPKGVGRRGRRLPSVAIVGKGITFDTGGISIKGAAKMEDMKFDMCGGAAVFGAMMAVARLKLPLRVTGLVPLAENMPDGNAYKPGDILRAMNGVTIEIKNTDAEGRLVLADALAYAAKHVKPRPEALIDAATLTGACVVALGDQFAAVLGHDDVCERLLAASKLSGDALWRLPLHEGYRRQLDSAFADIANLGSAGAGVQTGAAFLERFTDGLPWAHLDIAGMAWTERDGGLLRKGATGYGVRLLVEALRAWGGPGRRRGA